MKNTIKDVYENKDDCTKREMISLVSSDQKKEKGFGKMYVFPLPERSYFYFFFPTISSLRSPFLSISTSLDLVFGDFRYFFLNVTQVCYYFFFLSLNFVFFCC